MIKMYFRVAFMDSYLSNMNSDGFTNEDEAVDYGVCICNKYSGHPLVSFDVIKYYEWSKY
jgi:hypothetical protein